MKILQAENLAHSDRYRSGLEVRNGGNGATAAIMQSAGREKQMMVRMIVNVWEGVVESMAPLWPCLSGKPSTTTSPDTHGKLQNFLYLCVLIYKRKEGRNTTVLGAE